MPQTNIYAIDYGGCVPFAPVDFLLSSDPQIDENNSIGGDLNTGGNGTPNLTQLGNSYYDDIDNNLNCNNSGIIVSYTTETGFVGNDLYNYNVQNQEGTDTIATGLIVVEVLSPNVGNGNSIDLPTGFNIDMNSSSFGQISVGGNNSQISPTAQFTPPSTDSYTASTSLTTEPTEKTINNITGIGTESLDIKISSDFFSNGDWFYAETVIFSYSISNDDGVFWGNYSYALFAGSIDGAYHHTFVLNTSDYFFVTENIDDSQSGNTTTSYTSKAIGGTVDTLYSNYVDDSNKITAVEIHNTTTASNSISYGTYQYTITGGTVDGEFSSANESRNSSLQKIINVTENEQTTTTGSFTISTYNLTTNSYEGNGDYLIKVNSDETDDFTRTSGNITENGSKKDESTYNISGTLVSDGEWTKTGTAVLYSEYDSYFYNYDKYKFQISDSDTNGNWTDSGRYINISETSQDGNQTTNLTLTEFEVETETDGVTATVEEWVTVSGNGENNAATFDSTDNKVTRTYEQTGSADGKTWTNNGTVLQREKTDYTAEHNITSTWGDDDWVYSGEGSGEGNNSFTSTFTETGTYESTFTQDNIEFSITDGTASRSGSDKFESTFTTSSELVDGEWVDIGDGTATGTSKSKSEYSGTGIFELTITDERIVGNNILSGEVEESGNEKFKSEWSSEIELQNGEWVNVSGEGSTTSNGKTLFEYSGEITTTEQYTEENTEYDLSTERKVSGKEKSSWETESQDEIVEGEWATVSGSGESDNTSLQEFSTASTGNYTTTSPPATATTTTGDNNSFTINGDISFGENNKEKAVANGTLTWNTSTSEWDTTSVVVWKINCNNYFDKVSTEGNFEESAPKTTVPSSCALSDNSTGQLTTVTEKSLTGTIAEEFHSTYSFDSNYTVNIDAAGEETLASGDCKTKRHEEAETVWNGDGTFSQNLTYKNADNVIINVTNISGKTKIDDKKTKREYDETVKEEVAGGEWKLLSGNYKDVTKETGTTKITTKVKTKNYFGTATETKKTKTVDKSNSNIKTVYKGEVVSGATADDDKIWKQTATSTDNSSGLYSYEEEIEEAAYSREINGGTVSGTITISKDNTEKYGADNVIQELQGEGESAEWKVVSGSRWTESSITETESCEGTGSYSTNTNGISLTGTISESLTYSTTSTDAKITETYNATTDKWTKSSGEGSITYSETTTFSDTATGTFEVENGTGTINERKVSEYYSYSATKYLSSGITDYNQTVTSTYKYDAKQNFNTNSEQSSDGTLTGEKKQWTKDEITNTETLVWSEESDGLVVFTGGIRASDFEFESGVSFEMNSDGAGSTNFTEYSCESKVTSKSDDLEETLDVGIVNDYLEVMFLAGEELTDGWFDDFWVETGGSVMSTEKYGLDWKKSNEDSDVNQTIWGHNFVGVNDWSEEYEVDRTLTITETFSDGSEEDIEAGIVAGTTGSGTETIKHYRNDNFTADEESYTYYGATGTYNAYNKSHTNSELNFDLTFVTESEVEDDWYWETTGTGQIDCLSDWCFECEAAATNYQSTEQTTIDAEYYEKATYYEQSIVNQTYSDSNGWTSTSIITADENENENEENEEEQQNSYA
ncbi:MAG: hypothetical protein LBC74_01205, partial [Planctomycetaceae bacterium]|nr:hypothetical protein [Planctomycetaceae bacterium]